jgi:hypothetical protein
MQVDETPEQRYDRLILDGILALVKDGIAQWCFSCKDQLIQPQPRHITHAVIDTLARLYSDHTGRCFAERYGQVLEG